MWDDIFLIRRNHFYCEILANCIKLVSFPRAFVRSCVKSWICLCYGAGFVGLIRRTAATQWERNVHDWLPTVSHCIPCSGIRVHTHPRTYSPAGHTPPRRDMGPKIPPWKDMGPEIHTPCVQANPLWKYYLPTTLLAGGKIWLRFVLQEVSSWRTLFQTTRTPFIGSTSSRGKWRPINCHSQWTELILRLVFSST